jgi:hypothetical protein
MKDATVKLSKGRTVWGRAFTVVPVIPIALTFQTQNRKQRAMMNDEF